MGSINRIKPLFPSSFLMPINTNQSFNLHHLQIFTCYFIFSSSKPYPITITPVKVVKVAMDHNNKKNKQVGGTSHSHGSSSSSSTSTNLDHLFGPRDASSASSSYFGSIFPPPSSKGVGRESSSGNTSDRGSSNNFNSSIYYGGQENYNAPKSGSTYESKNPQHNNLKKDGSDDGDSRGNWWKGSLYY